MVGRRSHQVVREEHPEGVQRQDSEDAIPHERPIHDVATVAEAREDEAAQCEKERNSGVAFLENTEGKELRCGIERNETGEMEYVPPEHEKDRHEPEMVQAWDVRRRARLHGWRIRSGPEETILRQTPA